LKDTSEQPGPINVGVPVEFMDLNAAFATTSPSASEVITGQRYTSTVNGFVQSMEYYADSIASNIQWSVAYILNPGPTQVSVSRRVYPQAVGINIIYPVSQLLVRSGEILDIALSRVDTTTLTTSNRTYDYSTPNNVTVPGVGQIMQPNDDSGFLYINEIALSAVNTLAVLTSLKSGDTITIGGIAFTVSGVGADMGAYWKIPIVGTSQANDGNGVAVTFNSYGAVANPYRSVAAHFASNPNIQGFLSTTGYANKVLNTNAYAVDVKAQRVEVSADWAILSYPTAVGSAQASSVSPAPDTLVLRDSSGGGAFSGNITVGANTWNGSTITGAQAFSSTTRPTSSGTGFPVAASLIKYDDTIQDDTYQLAFLPSTGSANSTGSASESIRAEVSLSSGAVVTNNRVASVAYRNPLDTSIGSGQTMRLGDARFSVVYDIYTQGVNNNEYRLLYGVTSATATELTGAGFSVIITSDTTAKLQVWGSSLTESSSLTISITFQSLSRLMITWNNGVLKLYAKTRAPQTSVGRWTLIGTHTGTSVPTNAVANGNFWNVANVATGTVSGNRGLQIRSAIYHARVIDPIL
jgi:hypothetical protein